MITTTSNLGAKLTDLAGVIQEYARHSRYAPVEALSRKVSQLLLGIGLRESHSPGLHERLAATAPVRGRITRERGADSWRIGLPDSKSYREGLQKAADLLGGAKSGAFRITKSSSGGAESISKVQLGQIRERGSKRGQIAFPRRALKAARPARGVSRAEARAAGAVVLNLQALAAALTVLRREHSRGATAAQFLPRRYRRVLQRRPELTYRGGQAVGIASVDAAQQHGHERVLVENAKGRVLGSLELSSTPTSASAHLIGNLGLHTPAQEAALVAAIDLVTGDTAIYLARKQAERFVRAAQAGGLRAA